MYYTVGANSGTSAEFKRRTQVINGNIVVDLKVHRPVSNYSGLANPNC